MQREGEGEGDFGHCEDDQPPTYQLIQCTHKKMTRAEWEAIKETTTRELGKATSGWQLGEIGNAKEVSGKEEIHAHHLGVQ